MISKVKKLRLFYKVDQSAGGCYEHSMFTLVVFIMLYLTFSHAHESILLLDLLNFYAVHLPFDERSNVIAFL